MRTTLTTAAILAAAAPAVAFTPSRVLPSATPRRAAPKAKSSPQMLDVGATVGATVVASAVATHPIWLEALGIKKPKESTTTPESAEAELTEVRNYFNTVGFERWNKIYSDSDEVNGVQMNIRDGHQETIDTVLAWLDADGEKATKGKTICDLGCGVGTLAIPLAQRGATVSASDISASMANEASRRAEELGVTTATFEESDLESVNGNYDLVTCIDVMIHYPTDKMTEMVTHLGSLTDEKLLISFAPKTTAYVLLKKIGELFPGPSKTTRAYLHPEADVRAALEKAGFKVERSKLTAGKFYFSTLLEAVRV